MPTNETLRTATRDPTGFIDREYLHCIIDRFRAALTDPNAPTLAAALHRFVYTRVEYDDGLAAGLNRPPKDTVRSDGRCADQALLLYALCCEAGLTARITALEEINGVGQHALVEVGFRSAPDRVIDHLGSFYRHHGVVTAGTYQYIVDQKMSFFIADPTSSRYIGDDSGLQEMGYIASDGSVRVSRRFRLWGESDTDRPGDRRHSSAGEKEPIDGTDATQ
jgi:transglutaminase-like putative cysteine protease